MPTALRGLANFSDGSIFSPATGSYTVTLPGTVADGDIAVATVNSNGNSIALTTPPGWTLQSGVDAITTAAGSWLFYKVLTAADAGTTVSFTFANATRAMGHVEVISGGTLTGAVFGKTIPASAATSVVIPTLTGVLAGSYVGVHLPRRVGSGTAPVQTIPAPYTNDQRIASAATTSANLTSNIAHRIAASAGNYGGETVTSDLSSAGVAYAVAIPPAAPVVPKIATLTDGFATKDTSKWTWGSMASVVAGQLNFGMNTAYSGVLTSTGIYDLTGSAIYAQAVQAPVSGDGSSGTTETYLAVFDQSAATPNNSSYNIHVVGPNAIVAYTKNAAGAYAGVASATYSPTAHAWWRIRESGGTVFFETSPDAVTWTVLGSATTATATVPITSMRAVLGAGYWGTATPGTAIFDNVNTPPPTRSGKPKVWDGTAWVSRSAKVWDGAAWVTRPYKVWDSASGWVVAK